LKTFNWGSGYYIYLPESEVKRALRIAKANHYMAKEVGIIEKGERKVIFEPEGIELLPPGE